MSLILEVFFCLLLQQCITTRAETTSNSSGIQQVPKVYPVHTFKLLNDSGFEFDGKKIVLAGATMHYFRIPRDNWEHRLKILAESGLNTLFTAIDWSTHEEHEGDYRFTGENDFVYFIRIAEKLGLKVVLRPGPFIGEQRELGGYPTWLLWQNGDPDLTLKGQDFRHSLAMFFRELLPRIKPLLADHGGPVVMLEITQEAADCDWLMRIFRKRLGNHIMFRIFDEKRSVLSYQSVVSTLDGWRNASLETFSNSWSKLWHESVNQRLRYFKILQELLSGKSVGIGAFHAGTDFGFKAGASLEEDMLVSYSTADVDSLMYEDGGVNQVYSMLQTIVCSFFGREMSRPLPDSPTEDLGPILLSPIGSLLNKQVVKRLYKSWRSQKTPATFEEMRQGDGFVLYETRIKHNYSEADLYLHTLRDRAQVYLNYKPMGVVTRGFNDKQAVPLGTTREGDLLQIFVESLGRPYWGTESPQLSRKGLSVASPVIINMDVVTDWKMYGLPFDDSLDVLNIISDEILGLVDNELYEGTPFISGSTFLVSQSPEKMADTFLDMRGWGRGIVLLNGHNLGRYWPEGGSRKGLFVPKSYFLTDGNINFLGVVELDSMPSKQRVVFRLNLVDHHWVPMCNMAVAMVLVLICLSAILFFGKDIMKWLNRKKGDKGVGRNVPGAGGESVLT